MWQDLEIDAGCCGTKDKNVNGEDSGGEGNFEA
jgi:hypothetical protein